MSAWSVTLFIAACNRIRVSVLEIPDLMLVSFEQRVDHLYLSQTKSSNDKNISPWQTSTQRPIRLPSKCRQGVINKRGYSKTRTRMLGKPKRKVCSPKAVMKEWGEPSCALGWFLSLVFFHQWWFFFFTARQKSNTGFKADEGESVLFTGSKDDALRCYSLVVLTQMQPPLLNVGDGASQGQVKHTLNRLQMKSLNTHSFPRHPALCLSSAGNARVWLSPALVRRCLLLFKQKQRLSELNKLGRGGGVHSPLNGSFWQLMCKYRRICYFPLSFFTAWVFSLFIFAFPQFLAQTPVRTPHPPNPPTHT